MRLAVQARSPKRFAWWSSAEGLSEVNAETAAFMNYLGLTGMERAEAASLSYGGQRLLDMGLALATAPHIVLLDEPLAGLAAAERTRVAALVKTHLEANPGAAGRTRHRPRVPDRRCRHGDERRRRAGARQRRGRAQQREGARDLHRLRHRACHGRGAAVRGGRRDTARGRQGRHVLRQEPHPQCGVARRLGERDRRAARPQRRGQIDAAQDADRHRAARKRIDHARRRGDRAAAHPRRSRGAASATCRRAGACSPA